MSPPLWDAFQFPKRLIISTLRVQLRNLGTLEPATLGGFILSPVPSIWSVGAPKAPELILTKYPIVVRVGSSRSVGRLGTKTKQSNSLPCVSYRPDFSVVLLRLYSGLTCYLSLILHLISLAQTYWEQGPYLTRTYSAWYLAHKTVSNCLLSKTIVGWRSLGENELDMLDGFGSLSPSRVVFLTYTPPTWVIVEYFRWETDENGQHLSRSLCTARNKRWGRRLENTWPGSMGTTGKRLEA